MHKSLLKHRCAGERNLSTVLQIGYQMSSNFTGERGFFAFMQESSFQGFAVT